MHFLNVAEAYWSNPDVNNIQVFGKDIRTLLSITCQKIFFNLVTVVTIITDHWSCGEITVLNWILHLAVLLEMLVLRCP